MRQNHFFALRLVERLTGDGWITLGGEPWISMPDY